MDESLEKKVRSLKLKLLMAERELHAASGKWKLGAMLGAGHMSQMNREVVKVKERLEGKIEKLKSEISELTCEVLDGPATAAEAKPKPEPKKKAEVETPAAKAKEAPVKKTATKKAPSKKAAPAKRPAKKTAKKK